MLISIKKWGNFACVRIPSNIMKTLNLKLEDKLEVKEVDGKIVLEPVKHEAFKLENMLLSITIDNLHGRLDFGKPISNELI